MPDKSKNAYRHYILIIVAGAVFTIPAFLSDFYSGHNVLTHLLWSRHFAEQFWSGDLYPRWLMNMNSGLGSPAFFFYFPVPYLFTNLFHLPLLGLDHSGWLQLGLSSASALTLSGIGAYLWLEKLVDRNSAAIGAALYMIMPYHLLIDLYLRFAFTEFWAFAWMPLILYCSHLVVEGKRSAILSYAVIYSLLIMTHLPTTLLFSPVAILYNLFLCKSNFNLKLISRIIFANILAFGLSAFYLIPALTTQSNISMNIMNNGLYNYSKNFLFSSLNEQPPDSYYFLSSLNFVTVSVFLIAVLCFYLIGNNNENKSKQKRFWMTISIFSVFMMLQTSSFAWKALPLLQRIQFPYRMNTVLTVAVTALAAIALSTIFDSRPEKKLTLNQRFALVLFSSFFLSQMIMTVATVYARATGEWDPEKQRVIKQELDTSPEVPEYRPRWAVRSLLYGEQQKRPAAVIEGGNAKVTLWQPRRIVVATAAEKPSYLEIRHLFYPGWSAALDGLKESDLSVRPSPEGLISVSVPPGHHEIELTLQRQSGEKAGMSISVLSAFIGFLSLSRLFSAGNRIHDT
jgi:hypothetical protein